MVKQFPFPKAEKLKSRKLIEKIFEEGISFAVYPVRIVYITQTQGSGLLQTAFSVSKKRFASAVQRNRAKRLMREAYRMTIPELRNVISGQKMDLYMVFIYSGDTIKELEILLKSFGKIIERLSGEFNTN